MSLDKNKAIVCKMIETFNNRDLASLDKYIAPDYVDHYHQLQARDIMNRRGKPVPDLTPRLIPRCHYHQLS